MKVKMKKILEKDEKIIIPLFFCGNENKEYVELMVEDIYDELEKQLKDLEAKNEL